VRDGGDAGVIGRTGDPPAIGGGKCGWRWAEEGQAAAVRRLRDRRRVRGVSRVGGLGRGGGVVGEDTPGEWDPCACGILAHISVTSTQVIPGESAQYSLAGVDSSPAHKRVVCQW
jgi:hypothetical protein